MKPIFFNTAMVCAILENRKTVTRRVVKPQPSMAYCHAVDGEWFWTSKDSDDDMMDWWPSYETGLRPPYQPGDILYVRETWRVQSARRFDADARIEFKAGGDMVRIQFPGGGCQYHSRKQYDYFVSKWADDKWHPSIHMPRKVARIFLQVTDVRVERLHEFGIEDTKKEGVVPISRPGGCRCQWAYDGCMEEPCPNRAAYEIDRHVDPFVKLWDSTIKPADRALYGWEANPWVWVIEFERILKEEAG